MSHHPVNPVPRPEPPGDEPHGGSARPGTESNEDHGADRPGAGTAGRGSALSAGLAGAAGVVRKVPVRAMAGAFGRGGAAAGHTLVRAARAMGRRIPPLLAWLGTNLAIAGRKGLELAKLVPPATAKAGRSVGRGIQKLRGGKTTADARDEAALLAEAERSTGDGSVKTRSGSSLRLKLAIAGSCLVVAAAPFVARLRPGGGNGKPVTPPLALAGPHADEAGLPAGRDTETPIETPPDEPASSGQRLASDSRGHDDPVSKASLEGEGDPFAGESNGPPNPIDAQLAAQDAGSGPSGASEPPAIEGMAVAGELGQGGVRELKGSPADGPPDPFAASNEANGQGQAVGSPGDPPALTGLAALPLEPGEPLLGSAGNGLEPPASALPNGSVPSSLAEVPTGTGPAAESAAAEPAATVATPANPPGSAVAPSAARDAALPAPGGVNPALVAAPAAAAAAVGTAAALDRSGQPPKRVTSVAKGVSPDAIKLESPPADPAGANAVAATQPAVEVPEPSDPTLFAPLDRARRGGSNTGSAVRPVQAESDVVGGRIEPITHVVRRGENFWTIARHYYGSGRFYKALWKANAARVPRIDELYIGTSILVPAPEDLDPRYVEPASGGSTPERRRADPPAGNAAAPSAPLSRVAAPRDDNAVRTGRGDDRSTANDPDDLFAAGDEVAAGAGAAQASRARRGDSRTASTANPARRDPSADDPPPPQQRKGKVHVVKSHETLRSIAKKELGDSRREDELLELNRDLIDDPNHPPEGTPLRLPAR